MKPVELQEQKERIHERKINEIETSNKNKNIRDLYRGINESEKEHYPRTNLVVDANRDLLGDPHSTVNRWKNYFCQLWH
jgi:thymidylate kinase